MNRLISCILIITMIYVVGFCESGLFENVEKNNAAQSSVGKKPVCCIEVNSWSNDINILKDNIAFGFCAGYIGDGVSFLSRFIRKLISYELSRNLTQIGVRVKYL